MGQPHRPRASILVGAVSFLSIAVLGCGTASSGEGARELAASTEEGAPILFSEPEEYRARPISEEAGREYFSELGVGDPYGAGVPYPIFRALMARFPDELGRDMHALAGRFGFIPNVAHPDDPNALPVGFHLTRDPNTGVDFLVNNCAICHAGRVRTESGEQFVTGLGNREVRIHAYAAAFAHIAASPALDTAALHRASVEEAERLGLHWPSTFRRDLVSATVRELRRRFVPHRDDLDKLARGLPGRVATMEGFMVALNMFRDAHLRLPETTGWARVPDVATWRYRDTNSFDGAAVGDPVALVAEADFAFGVRPRWFDEHRHIATSMFLYLKRFERQLPYPAPIDRALATQGFERFESRCAGCHGHYARPGETYRVSYAERIVPLAMIGTDSARLDALTDELLEIGNAVRETEGLVLTRRTGGYVPRPLVYVWARGQYGHNGQWPDVAFLATPPDQRPPRFIVSPRSPMSLERLGQAWRPAEDGEAPNSSLGEYLYDGTLPGFAVTGHPFLADLPDADRRAVTEYLKTL